MEQFYLSGIIGSFEYCSHCTWVTAVVSYSVSDFTVECEFSNGHLMVSRVFSQSWFLYHVELLCLYSRESWHLVPSHHGKQRNSERLFLGAPKITADGYCSHEIKRCLLLDSILKSRDITLPTNVRLAKAMAFPVVMYGCESWIIKKVERQRIDVFEL